MRRHLHNSLERVRALAAASGIEAKEQQRNAAAASLFMGLERSKPAGQ
jgi:GntR family transcriptional repressor for pyruvate dehydrogenase complex